MINNFILCRQFFFDKIDIHFRNNPAIAQNFVWTISQGPVDVQH